MPRHIKTAALAGHQEEADAKIRGTVEGIIADVAKRGDTAVRDLSERFDKWSPPSFRLSASEIETLVAKVAPQTIEDIKFAQRQIRNFAEIQRASIAEIDRQLAVLPTADIAGIAWRDYGEIILCADEDELLAEANRIAAEHVEVLTQVFRNLPTQRPPV